MYWLTFSMIDSFGCGVMSLLSSFGCGTPCLLSKIMTKFIYCPKKNYRYEVSGTTAPDTVSPANISWLKLSHYSFHTFLKLINWHTIPSQIRARLAKLPVKWSVFEQKHHSNFTKCLVNKLKAAAFTASFLLCDVIESCVEILVVVLNRPAKFKLIKLWRLMSLISHRDRPSYGDICWR